MNLSLYVTFLIAVVVLVVIPGPTVLLVSSKSMRHGVRSGLLAVVGSAFAGVLHLSVVVAGLASVVVFVSGWFEWIRWIGVAYLLYLGIRAWTHSPDDGSIVGPSVTSSNGHRDFLDRFLVTMTNPKALLFHGAFLPQFVDPTLPALPQLLILAGSFLVVAVFLDCCWVLLAGRLGRFLVDARSRRLADRISGGLLIGAGLALALVRKSP